MKQLLVILSVVLVSHGQIINTFLPHSQNYGYIMEQLFDLRSQIRDCRGELICGIASSHGQYQTDVMCVAKEQICDGNPNCRSLADESGGCPVQCHDLIRCRNMQTCARPCDGNRECPDGDDEDGCPETCKCGAGNYLCEDGTTCITRDQICDGTKNCPGNDDEMGCPPSCRCNPGLFSCSSGQTCVAPSRICNGIENECPNNEDEANCPSGCKCSPGQFLCADGNTCLPLANICNDPENECCNDNAAICAGDLNEDNGPCPPGGIGGIGG